MRIFMTIAALEAGAPGSLAAFSGFTSDAALQSSSWTMTSLWAVTLATVGVAGYALGFAQLRKREDVGAAGALSAASFVTGMVLLCVAVSGPLHAYGRWSLGAHMGQHMLLFAYVPPLLLAGNPVAIWSNALPARRLARLRCTLRKRTPATGSALVPATALHSAVLWFWHHPPAITSTLFDDRLQLLMHASFVLSGLWFWAALARHVRDAQAGVGTAMIALVAMTMQMGLLGALLTFSNRVLYAVCSDRAPLLGLEPLADQQLAGLIMWVPACLPYLLGGLWLMQRWLSQAPHEHMPHR